MTSLATLLDSLPNELLAMIKANYDADDIRAHVHFSQISARMDAFYERDGDKFWRKLCFMNGLGYILSLDGSLDTLSWKDIAVKAIEHAHDCCLPSCSFEQIDENINLMWMATKQDQETDCIAYQHPPDPENVQCNNYLFSRISFRRMLFHDYEGDGSDLPECTWLEPAEDQSERVQELSKHPIALRSFSTFPPIKSVVLAPFNLKVVNNNLGVTVGDVCDAVLQEQGISLDAATICNYIRYFEPRTFDIPSTWSLSDQLNEMALGTLCGWFRIAHWTGLQYITGPFARDEDQNEFLLEFKPRDLPYDLSHFLCQSYVSLDVDYPRNVRERGSLRFDY